MLLLFLLLEKEKQESNTLTDLSKTAQEDDNGTQKGKSTGTQLSSFAGAQVPQAVSRNRGDTWPTMRCSLTEAKSLVFYFITRP